MGALKAVEYVGTSVEAATVDDAKAFLVGWL